MVLKNVTAVSVTVTMSLPLSESENKTDTAVWPGHDFSQKLF